MCDVRGCREEVWPPGGGAGGSQGPLPRRRLPSCRAVRLPFDKGLFCSKGLQRRPKATSVIHSCGLGVLPGELCKLASRRCQLVLHEAGE